MTERADVVEKKDIRDLSLAELRQELEALGEPAYRAEQIFAWLYKRGATSFEAFTDLSKGLRQTLAERFTIAGLELFATQQGHDRTEKFLFRLDDGQFIETVLIPAGERATVCVSTQVGCKYRCAFCASGRHGFKRNLRPAEITGQVLYLRDRLRLELTNVVFMGMGEPLDNFENLERVLRIMNAPEGMGLAARRLTVSTAGHVPGIRRFAELDLQVNLSLSLHAATDRLRSSLMPINKKWPLTEVVEAAEAYVKKSGRMMTIEWVLLAGVNDTPEDAEGLAAIAKRLRAKVNLIPFSPVAGCDFQAPDEARTALFRRRLEERRVRVTVRESKGRDILAACGQLAGRPQ
jgi:23S rRNA (adenine2503-C2)-methyltransferase